MVAYGLFTDIKGAGDILVAFGCANQRQDILLALGQVVVACGGGVTDEFQHGLGRDGPGGLIGLQDVVRAVQDQQFGVWDVLSQIAAFGERGDAIVPGMYHERWAFDLS